MPRQRTYWVKQYERDIIRSRNHSAGPFPYVLVLDHLKAGFNVPKILRSANVFGASEVHLVGIPMFDPTPGKGGLRHTRTRAFETIVASLDALRKDGYRLFALHMAGSAVVGREPLPERSAFIFGHEEWGFSFEPAAIPDVTMLRIPQYGPVQSLNVSVAASIMAFEWIRQHGPADAPPDRAKDTSRIRLR